MAAVARRRQFETPQSSGAGSDTGTRDRGPVLVPSPLVRKGNLLVREGIPLPSEVEFVSQPFLSGWRLVRQPRPADLERSLSHQGWSLFAMAGDVSEAAMALNWEQALHKALQKLSSRASTENLNAIEVVQVTMRQFLGVRWVRVTARLRHIQEGPYLFKTAEQMAFDSQRVVAAVSSIQMAGRRLGREYRQFKSM